MNHRNNEDETLMGSNIAPILTWPHDTVSMKPVEQASSFTPLDF